MTENDILAYLGKKFCGVEEQGHPAWKSEQFISKTTEFKKKAAASCKTDEDYANFARELIKLGKLAPLSNLDQLWNFPPLEELRGKTREVHTHWYWSYIEEKIMNEFKPHSNTMTIVSCVNLKPYDVNPNYSFLINREKERYTDLFINAAMLWPMRFNRWIAARVYDIIECIPGDRAYNDFSAQVKIERTIRYIEKWNYKKVIIWAKPDEMYDIYNSAIEVYCKEHNINFCVIMTPDMEGALLNKFGNIGLVHQRHFSQPEPKNKYDLAVNYPYPTKIPSKKEQEEFAAKNKQKKTERKEREEDKAKLMKCGWNFRK